MRPAMCAFLLMAGVAGAQERVAFTAEIITTARAVAGKPSESSSRRIYAVRRDGSSVEQEKDTAITRSRDDGVMVEVDYRLKRKSTTPLSRSAMEMFDRLPAGDDCEDDPKALAPMTLVGRETVNGVDTVKYVAESNMARRTEWRAPGLNCFAVKRVVERKGSRNGWLRYRHPVVEVVTEVATVTLGEPSSELFRVPEHFVEGPPARKWQVARKR